MNGASKPQKAIFVGGISLQTTQNDLIEHFKKFTKIVAVKLPIDKRTGFSRGYAIIKVAAETNLGKLTSQVHVVKGRQVDCQVAARKRDRGKQQEDLKKRKIFVNGLPTNLSEEKFKEFFAQYFPIRSAFLIKDNETGVSRGYGFVEFKSGCNITELCKTRITIEQHDLEISPYKYKYESESEEHEQQSPPESSEEREPQLSPAKDTGEGEARGRGGYEHLKASKWLNEEASNYVFRIVGLCAADGLHYQHNLSNLSASMGAPYVRPELVQTSAPQTSQPQASAEDESESKRSAFAMDRSEKFVEFVQKLLGN